MAEGLIKVFRLYFAPFFPGYALINVQKCIFRINNSEKNQEKTQNSENKLCIYLKVSVASH